MRRQPSPAQRAVQITFVLKGHLKNVQVAYIRAGALLAKMRDERLYRALGHATIEAYAAARLGLQRSALYHYLQIHDWIRAFHPAWLAPRPKGFIPELSDASALMWIEHRLRDERLGEGLRTDLEALRQKALAGKLTASEFRAFRDRVRSDASPLRTFLARLRALRRRAAGVPKLPAGVLDALDAALQHAEAALTATGSVARLEGLVASRIAGRRGPGVRRARPLSRIAF